MSLFLILIMGILLLSASLYLWLSDTALDGTPLQVVAAILVATVFVSILFDASRVASFPYQGFIWTSLMPGAGLLFYCSRRRELSLSKNLPGLASWRASVFSVVILGLIVWLSYAYIGHSGRWGRWDARAIWSLHALFLADARHWADQFSHSMAWSHPDYPLMLPSFVAMFWTALGTADPIVPCAISYAVFIAVLLTVSTGLREQDKPLIAILGLLVFLFADDYILWAASQGADSLLSLFILMALVLQHWNATNENRKLLFLMGFIAGFAGWVKNEGIPFTLIFSLAMIWQYRKKLSSLTTYAAGLVLPALVIFVFKFCYAPPNDIIAGQGQSTLSKITDLHRYVLTSKIFAIDILHLYPLLIVAALLIFLKGIKRLLDAQLLILVIMIVVYYFIFIITPRDLAWHLETASERLFLQLFPAFVFVLLRLIGEEQAVLQND